MRLVTTRDIVIPAGTEVDPAPSETQYFTPHGSILIEVNKDATADLRLDLDDAIKDGLIEVAE